MKKAICLALTLLLILSIFAISGCSKSVKQLDLQVIKSYPKDAAPSQIVKTDNHWILLMNTYGQSKYSISVGEDLDGQNEIYSVDDVKIWYIDANENAIVWSERTTDSAIFKLYDLKTQKVETFFKINRESYQPMNVGIYLNKVYYGWIDYENQEVYACAYDIGSKAPSVVYKEAYVEENLPYSTNLDGEYLSFVSSGRIKVFDLKNNEIPFDASLPDDVVYAYTASYDKANETCAVYYADGDSEDIGIFKESDFFIDSHITFPENVYAFHEKVECVDGHMYLIIQRNVSGQIADHYDYIDYDYTERMPLEGDMAFSFCRSGDETYLLRYNGSEYTHIELCKY